jgi:hypothetical protein
MVLYFSCVVFLTDSILMMMRVASSVGRQFIVIWFDHTQPSPLLPMASTGHPSMASLQSASSSGVVGCLNT